MTAKSQALAALKNVSHERAVDIVATVGARVYRPVYEKMIAAGISHQDAMAAILARLQKNLTPDL